MDMVGFELLSSGCGGISEDWCGYMATVADPSWIWLALSCCLQAVVV